MSGLQSYVKGHAAEQIVRRHYEGCGARVAAQNKRIGRAEIDLIVRDGAETVFVEVKTSRTHERAAQAIRQSQLARIALAAQKFMDEEGPGSMSAMRIDVALVDGRGLIDVIEGVHIH